jgi:hypothetical protein
MRGMHATMDVDHLNGRWRVLIK